MRNFTFNNEKKEWLYLLSDFERPPFASINRSLINVAGMSGAYLSSTTLEPLTINAQVGFKFKNAEEGMKLKEEMASWLFTDEPAPLQFDDEPDRTYYAIVQNTMDDFEEFIRFKRGTIEFICLDPYKYGPEETLKLEDISTIENKGTAPADPIFELTAKEKSTFAMISIGADEDAEYNLIGTPADVDEVVVDERNLILNERGETLDTWGEAGTKVDSNKAEVTGTLGTDGTGVVVLNYGSPSSDATWYGPALLKEINPIQDFEVEMRLRAESKRPSDVYRIEFYLFDENMDTIGKMAIWDNSQAKYAYVAEGRVGDYVGKQQNYLISSKNYNYERKHFHGMVRMRRIGNRFEFYVARTAHGSDETGRHYDEFMVPFIDIDDEYMGRLKYVQIHIGTHSKGTKVNLPRINNFKVTEIKKATVDQTPYILYPEDVVTFDHKNDDLLINGEPRNDLKNFGGSFFKLKKGFNELIVTPSETFDSKLIYEPKYL